MSTPEITPAPLTPEAPPIEVPMNQLSRIVNIFFEPGKVFEDLKRGRSWWMVWLLGSVIGAASMFAVQQHIGWRQVAINQIQRSAQADKFDQAPPAQQAQQLAIMEKSFQFSAYLVPVLSLLITAIMAAVLMGVYNFALGAKIDFKHSWAITYYASVPSLLSGLLGIVVIFFADPTGFDLSNPIPTSVGSLLNPVTHKFLATFLGAFDVFTIWTCALMGIGYSKVSKIKAATGFYVIFGLVIVFKLISAGIAAMVS